MQVEMQGGVTSFVMTVLLFVLTAVADWAIDVLLDRGFARIKKS